MPQSDNTGKELTTLIDEELATNPEFQKAWEATALKRSIATGLVRMRRRAGLTQRQLAQQTGWDPAFVSRLESVSGKSATSLPDISTILVYAAACGSEMGWLFTKPSPGQVEICETVALSDDPRVVEMLEGIEGTRLPVSAKVEQDADPVETLLQQGFMGTQKPFLTENS